MTYRFPAPPHTGDRIRAGIWLEALAPIADVTLIAPAGTEPLNDIARHVVVPRLRRAPIPRAGALAAGRIPWHAVPAGLYDWEAALRAAGRFDVAVVILSRLHPWVHPHLRAGRRILDAIDSSAHSMRERARASAMPLRAFWNLEAKKAAALESALHDEYEEIVVISALEAAAFGRAPRVVPSGVVINTPSHVERDFDFGFWGRLGYFANQRAIEVLCDEVWPIIHRARPGARLLIAGADAPRSITRRGAQPGITVESPMRSAETIRRIRIALFPLQFGTGQPTKVLEAAAAPCAIITTPATLQRIPEFADAAWSASSSEEMATKAITLLDDTAATEAMSTRLRELARQHYDRAAVLERLRAIALAS